MSTAAKGNARVDAVAESLAGHGYVVACIKASGRRGNARRGYHVAGDLLAIRADGVLVLQVEVGGSKPIAPSLREIQEHLWPGAIPLLVRFIGRRRQYHAVYEGETLSSDALQTIFAALRNPRTGETV